MKKKEDQIIWLQGGYYARRVAFQKIIAHFPEHEMHRIDADASGDELINAIRSVGCFSDGRIVHIVDMPKFDNSNDKTKFMKAFKQAMKVLANEVIIIFNGVNPSKERALLSHIKKIGRYIEFPWKLKEDEARAWIRQRVSEFDRDIEPDAIEYLVTHCGYDSSIDAINADMLESSVRKLAAFSSDNMITKDDVIATAINSENIIAWDFTDAIDHKNVERCFQMIDTMVAQNGDIRSSILPLISLILWRYKLIFFLKESLTLGLDKHAVSLRAGALRKFSSEGNGMSAVLSADIVKTGENAGQEAKLWSDGAIKMALNGGYNKSSAVDILSRRDLYRILNCIQNIYSTIRLNGSETTIRFMVDVFILTACDRIDDISSEKLRKACAWRCQMANNEFDHIFKFNSESLKLFCSLSLLHEQVVSFHSEPTQENAKNLVKHIESYEVANERFKSSIGNLVKGLDESEPILEKDENGYKL